MTAEDVPASLTADALSAKSKLYIGRALARKNDDDLDEYQLWASLALELLGKAALSEIHPSLIVDPTHYPSLFAAAGVSISTDVKTIGAHTIFERLRHLAPRFDERARSFCVGIAQRRNAELHSGEAPFRAMKLESWQAQYWHACSVILDRMDSNLDEWLGADNAKAPKEVVEHAIHARKEAASIRIKNCSEDFQRLKKAEQETSLADASRKWSFNYRELFNVFADEDWPVSCPSCTGKSYVAGTQISEEISEDEDGEAWEFVEKTYTPEEFRCPTCGLHLQGIDELEVAGLDADHVEIEEREIDYGPEYGND